MQKKQNINKIRAIACLMVLIYHSWALCGSAPIKIPVLREFVSFGGVIGVTLFFALSGYGIYCSLLATEQSGGKISFWRFMGKRIERVVPHYYFNLMVALLFTSAAVYITVPHFENIIAHLFFYHSFHIDWHGAINGVLWTMAVIFQFYLIAIPLYFFVKKFRHWAVIIAIAFTVCAHHLTLNYLWIIDETVYGDFAYSVPGRQIWTALDNFVVGMYVAHLVNTPKQPTRHWPYAIGCVVSTAAVCGCCVLGYRYGVWGRGWWNSAFHSILAIIIGLLLFCAANTKNDSKSLISRALLWVSKYEYGIYLWHLLIMNNLLAYSSLIQALLTPKRMILAHIGLISASIFTGFIMTRLISGLTFRPAKVTPPEKVQPYN